MAKKVLSMLLIVALLFVFSAATPIQKQVTDTSVKVVSPLKTQMLPTML